MRAHAGPAQPSLPRGRYPPSSYTARMQSVVAVQPTDQLATARSASSERNYHTTEVPSRCPWLLPTVAGFDAGQACQSRVPATLTVPILRLRGGE